MIIAICYRKDKGWRCPQILFGADERYQMVNDFVVAPQSMHGHITKWIELGLTQSVLVNGYNNNINDVHILRQK